jgi:hypothetical protein
MGNLKCLSFSIFQKRKCILNGTQIQLRFTKHFHGWSKSLNQHLPLHHPPDAWLWLSCGWSSTELISCFNLVIHSGAMLENRGPLSCHPSSMVWWWLVVHSGCLVHCCLFMPLSKIIQIQELGKSCVDKQTLSMLIPAKHTDSNQRSNFVWTLNFCFGLLAVP